MNNIQTQRIYFLDGLRGWGAIIILLYHIWVDGFPISKESANFLKNIFIFNGYLAVYIFFITSGFSLTISYFRKNDTLILKRLLAGRYFRLIIPIGFASIIFFIALRAGLVLEPDLRPKLFKHLIIETPSFLEFAKFHFFEVLYNYNQNKSLIPPLWTMKFEFISSIAIIISLLLFHKIKNKSFILIGLIILASFFDIFYSLFFIGALSAWLYSKPQIVKNSIGFIMFCVSMFSTIFTYDFGLPTQIACSIGFFISAIIWQPFTVFLSSSLSIYLGKISFPLYLIHPVVMWVIGLNLIGIMNNFIINFICMLMALISAHFMVRIDEFSTLFSRKVGLFFFNKAT